MSLLLVSRGRVDCRNGVHAAAAVATLSFPTLFKLPQQQHQAASFSSSASPSSSSPLPKKFQELLKHEIQLVRQDVFGTLPNLNIGRTGHQNAKKTLTGAYLNNYYLDPIEKAAVKVFPGWMNEQQERRHYKLMLMKRRGKGAPKKGAGSKKSKK